MYTQSLGTHCFVNHISFLLIWVVCSEFPKGAPFSSVYETLQIGHVPSISGMILSVGFLISEELVAVVWIRCDTLRTSSASTDFHALPTKACCSECSRNFLPPVVCTRKKELYNKVCSRDTDGVMLAEK
jgi:hypothetical protein